MRTNKALFKGFENADSETIRKLTGYINSDNDDVKERVFQKSVSKYMQSAQSDSMGRHKNIAHITNVTVAKRTGRAVKLALSGVAAACAVAVGFAVVRPMLDKPDTFGNSSVAHQHTVNGRELWTAVPPDQASKEDIFWLMMNSIFYYDSLSGTVYSGESHAELYKIDFQFCLSSDNSHTKALVGHLNEQDREKLVSEEDYKNCIENMDSPYSYEQYSDGNRKIERNSDTNELETSLIQDHKSIYDIKPVQNSDRIKYDADKEATADSLYPDPTPELLDGIAFPQKTALYGMLDKEKWYTDGIIIINGRESYHIILSENETDDKIEMWTDVRTGIILKCCIYEDGRLEAYTEIDNIRFDDEAEPVTPMPDDIKAEKDAFDDLTGSDDIDVLTRNIAQMQEQLSELDAKIEKLKDPTNTVLSEEEKQASLAELEEKRNTVQLAINELNAKLIEEIEKHNTELNENYNEQLKRLNELKKQYGNKTAENTAPRKLEKAVSPEKATKKDVYHLLLNSIYYYDKVSGTVYLPTGNNFDMVSKIEFQTVLSASKAYEHYTSYDIDDINTSDMADIKEISKISTHNVDDREMFCDLKNNVYISLNNISKEYENDNVGDITTMENVEKIEDDERITVAGDGYPCYSYTTDPTNIFEASSECLFAQGLTMGFLQDFNQWDIKGTAKYEDKECFCISGTASNEYGAGHNVATFDFWVDAKTGVLLQYAGYDENGNICDYVYTENIAYEDSAHDVKNFSESFIEGYKPFG